MELSSKYFYMKTQFENEDGLTLIELLVVIIIISILASIAFPSFLNQANKARESEAVTNIGAINRAQQAYITEKLEFASLSQLQIGIKDTQNYTYSSTIDRNGTTNEVITTATPANSLRGYAGRTWVESLILNDTPESWTLICPGNVNEVPDVKGLRECE